MKPSDSHSRAAMPLVAEPRDLGPAEVLKNLSGFSALEPVGYTGEPMPAQSERRGAPSADTIVPRADEPRDPSWARSNSGAVVHPLERARALTLPVIEERKPLFEGVFLGGFECSSHRLEDGRRLDITRASRHDEFANADYARLRQLGMTACRDGVSWVRAERTPGHFDFSFTLPMLDAARRQGITVIWDLMHFGWPNDVNVFSPDFPVRFGRYAGTFARFLNNESDAPALMAPINEMSYLAWAGGDVRCMNPFESARGVEMKVQLVRATIEAIEAIRRVLPKARFLQPEPVINIVPHPDHPKTWRRVEADNLLQYQAWDMLCGNVWPSLGGHPRYLDVIGVNFYSDNQFMLDGTTIFRGHPNYRSFSAMLLDVWQRYQRPMIVSETGHEGEARADWLRYVATECELAMQQGCELHGVTLYPIVSTLGWGDDRRCENGLWGDANEYGERPICEALLREIANQAPRLRTARARMLAREFAHPPRSGSP